MIVAPRGPLFREISFPLSAEGNHLEAVAYHFAGRERVVNESLLTCLHANSIGAYDFIHRFQTPVSSLREKGSQLIQAECLVSGRRTDESNFRFAESCHWRRRLRVGIRDFVQELAEGEYADLLIFLEIQHRAIARYDYIGMPRRGALENAVIRLIVENS